MSNSTTSIVFYCKDCNAMFFAAANEPNVLRDCGRDIARYIKAGHGMAEVTHEDVRKSFSHCRCNEQGSSLQMSFANVDSLQAGPTEV